MSAPATTRPPAPPPAPHSPPGPSLARLVSGGLLILFGLSWLARATGLVEVRWRTVLALAVMGTGLVLLASARSRRADGLVGLGIVLGVMLVVTSATGLPVFGGTGEPLHRPTTVGELEDRYELGAGPLTLDLRELSVPPGTTAVEASLGAGDLVVRLPADAAVDVDASAGLGEVVVLDRRSSGFGPSVTTSQAGSGGGQLALDLSVGLGRIEVTR